ELLIIGLVAPLGLPLFAPLLPTRAWGALDERVSTEGRGQHDDAYIDSSGAALAQLLCLFLLVALVPLGACRASATLSSAQWRKKRQAQHKIGRLVQAHTHPSCPSCGRASPCPHASLRARGPSPCWTRATAPLAAEPQPPRVPCCGEWWRRACCWARSC